MAKRFTDFQLFNDDQDENEEENQANKFRVKTNATLYLVDAGKKMFSNSNEDEESDFVKSLKVIFRHVISHVV